MKNILIILFILLVGLNGFGQSLKPISELKAKYSDKYDLSEYFIKLINEIDSEIEKENKKKELNPCGDFRNINHEVDSCGLKTSTQIRVNMNILDSIDSVLKLKNFNTNVAFSDTIYYALITEVPFTILNKKKYAYECKTIKLNVVIKHMFRKRNAYKYQAISHYKLISNKNFK